MMMRLSEPQYSFEQTLDECVTGITGNVELQRILIAKKFSLAEAGDQYLTSSGTGELYTIPPIRADRNADPIVINTLKKSDLVKIYEQYFVPEKKPARKIYNALLNAAKEKCPFCGGIGTPRNLDHFLPKAYFPQYAVLPHNLVPACRDCNMDSKAHTFATNAEEQIIQPYTDADHFFIEQWIFANYHADDDDEEEPGEFEYYVFPPENWTKVDKQRVKQHFKDFNLAKRYAIKSAENLGIVLPQIRHMRNRGIDSDDIHNILLKPAADNAPFPNHWQKGMYQALMEAKLV